MKKSSIILILTAFAMISCAKNEILTAEKPDSPIDFSWYASRGSAASTKADPGIYVAEGATHLHEGASFGVFGYFHPQYEENGVAKAGGWKDNVNNNYPNLFYNEGVTIGLDNTTYSYDYVNSRYWPKNKLDRISFFAYYPYNPLGAEETPSDDTIVEPFLDKNYVREGLVGFYYTVPTTAAESIDFMISDLCLDQSKAVWDDNHAQGLTGTENGKVKFYFHHALSQVRIKPVQVSHPGNDKIEVKINYVRFTNVAVFGQCYANVDYAHRDANTGRTPVTPNWPVGGLSPRRPGETKATGVTAEPCYDEHGDLVTENILLMIPHTFLDGARIEVNFDVVRKNEDSSELDEEHYNYADNTLSAPLSVEGVRAWEAGKIYTYYVSLNLKTISITADVQPWREASEDIFLEKQNNNS